MKYLICFLFFLFLLKATDAQQINADKYKANPVDTAVLQQVLELMPSKDFTKASNLQNKLLKELKNDPKGNLRLLNDIAKWWMSKRKYQEGKQLIDTLFKIYPSQYDTIHFSYSILYSNLAYYHYVNDHFDRYLKYLKKQAEIIKQIDAMHPFLCQLYTQKAGALFANRRLNKGFNYANKSLQLANSNNLDYYVVQNYLNMANIIKFYEPYMALDFMEYTVYYAMKYQKEYYSNSPYFYINYGSCYFACDKYDKAIAQFKKGLEVLKKSDNPEIKFETAFYYYLGVSYKNTGQFQQAADYFQKSAKVYEKYFSKKNRSYISNLSASAKNLIEEKLYEEALPILQEIYPLALEVFGYDNTYTTIQIGRHLGKSLLNTGQALEALKQFNRSIYNFYGDSLPGNPFRLPKMNPSGKGQDRASLFLCYLGKANALKVLYEKNPSDSLLENILAHYDQCAQVSDISANAGPLADKDVRTISYHLRTLTNSALDFAISNQLAKKEMKIIYKIISKNKAYSMLASVHKSKQGYYGNDQFLREKSDSAKKIEIELKNQNFPDSGALFEEKHTRLLTLKQKVFLYKQEHPAPADNLTLNRAGKIYDKPLNTGIDDDEVVIDIFLTNNNLVTFSFAKDEFAFTSRPRLGNLKKNTKKLQKAIKNAGNIETVSKELYEAIFVDIESTLKNKNKITIIPDGILYTIPFEALMNSNNQYLIENYLITYRYTSHLYESSQETVSNNSFLAMAPFFDTENNIISSQNPLRSVEPDSVGIFRGDSFHLVALPYSLEETKLATNYLNKKQWKTKLLLYNNANEKAFKDNVSEYAIIHLATHGFADTRNPENSGLFLSQVKTGSDDNYLYMSEIYNLKIHADLVVLSACKSGYGLIWESEGVVALPRSFLAGGTKNVISSLWRVHDKKTKKLMVHFYNVLANNRNYEQALRKAKLKMIKDGELPMDWSGFVLITN